MNLAQFFLSVIAGISASLIAFSIISVRGDLVGIFRFLAARREAKQLLHAQADPALIAQAKAHALQIAQEFADPQKALILWPFEVFIGLIVAVVVWKWFDQRLDTVKTRLDIHERMVLRFAYRHGSVFTLRDLCQKSPLTPEQAHAITAQMRAAGRLVPYGEGYALSEYAHRTSLSDSS